MATAGAKDLLLPVAIVAVVGMMVFPLPGLALDALLMVNIAFALSLLLSAVYLAQPERFTSLPTILLLSTLFRLGLNISTTRQILSKGQAPEIVSAFGEFVVQGNLVVGIVVFIIITVVQFLVIAKGAERVAEVAARFTLDAMPGKQMSVDADIRSGFITLKQAREKRLELQKESKLFGALDGAMKFVKGDAIAGLLITILNISAGIIIGVSQLSLSFGESVQRFTLFTIGDGLVSQIPALLVAVAAGIAVTRVSDKDNSYVGRELLSQLGREPQAVAVTAVVLFGLSLVPGMPFFLFAFMGVALGLVAVLQQRKLDEQAAQVDEVAFRPQIYSNLVFKISPQAIRVLQTEKKLSKAVQEVRTEIFEKWGLMIPDVQFDVDRAALDSSVAIYIKGVEAEYIKAPEQGSFSEKVASAFAATVEQKLSLFVDDTQTRQMLEVYQPLAEDLINSLVPEKISVTGLTSILRELVRDRIRVSEFSEVLQGISEYFLEKEAGTLQQINLGAAEEAMMTQKLLLERVRIKLSRTITSSLAERRDGFEVYSLPREIELVLAEAFLTATPTPANLADVILGAIGSAGDAPKVIVTSSKARPLLAELTKGAVSVYAYEELEEVPETKELPLLMAKAA